MSTAAENLQQRYRRRPVASCSTHRRFFLPSLAGVLTLALLVLAIFSCGSGCDGLTDSQERIVADSSTKCSAKHVIQTVLTDSIV